MSDPKHPKPCDQVLDLSDLSLVDITPERVVELTKVRSGYRAAVDAVVNVAVVALKRAGIDPDDVQALVADIAVMDRIDEVIPAVEKLHEMLHETRQLKGHAVGTRLGEMAQQVRRRADRALNGAEIEAPFEPLLKYQSAPAVKAAATKAKNNPKKDKPKET